MRGFFGFTAFLLKLLGLFICNRLA